MYREDPGTDVELMAGRAIDLPLPFAAALQLDTRLEEAPVRKAVKEARRWDPSVRKASATNH